MKFIRARLKALPALLFGLLALACTVVLRAYDPPLLVAQRGAGFDTLQRIWPRSNDTPQPVRIVDIDEVSLKALGQWPWQRQKLATLVNELNELGAAAIAFDIVFPEPDRLSPRRILQDPDLAKSLVAAVPNFNPANLPDSDQAFASAIIGKPVVTAFASGAGPTPDVIPVKAGFAQTGASATDAPPKLGAITANLPEIDNAATGIGGINIDLAGEQGVARQVPMLWTDGKRFYPSLAIEALRVAQGADTFLVRAAGDTENAIESLVVGDIQVPLSEQGMFHVYYRENAADMYVSAAEVINGNAKEKLRPLIEGNVVFIGTSAVGLLDVRTTALGQSVPGVSIHAQAVEQMLSGQFLTRPEWAVGTEFVLVALLGSLIVLASALYRPWAAIVLTAATLAALLGGIIYAFRSLGLLFDATFPVIALGLVFLATTAFKLLVTDKQGRQMRRVFGQYVAPSVLAEIEKNPENLKLGGEVRDVTVMFVDIVNFTPLGEKLQPEELVNVVNGLWDVCTEAILAEQGTIDKFIGDAVMAFWNAPLPCVAHQARASAAALRIRQGVENYNQTPALKSLLQASGTWPLAVRVGLASGEACVGNMGSKDRFDYSVLGETVNTAARAESTCKLVGHDIVIAGKLSPETNELAVLSAGFAAMKGKSAAEAIHVLIGDKHYANSDAFIRLKKEYSYVAEQFAQKLKPDALSAISQLLEEMSIQHPEVAKYLHVMASRQTDFMPARP